jgi:glycosyltransferase involved in cell wall biosynthesis
MSCGRAVIATQAGGAAELFVHGETALGVPPDCVAELAAALTQLIASPALRMHLGRKAAESAAAFSRSRMGEQLLAHLTALTRR